jgi:uncharacterized membrane protein (DUF485 family)
MSNAETNHAQRYARIRNHPKFRQLARSRARLAWTLTTLVLGSYYLFMLVVAFFPQWLHAPLRDGSHLTVGIPVAATIIVLSWLLTGWYVRSANTRFDALSSELLEELQ